MQPLEKGSYDGFAIYRTMGERRAKPEFEKLDSINRNLIKPREEFFYLGGPQAVYQSKHHDKTYLFLVERVDNDFNKNNVAIYDVSSDRFDQHRKFRMDTAYIYILEHSIDGDKYEDWWIRRAFPTEFWFFSGGTDLSNVPSIKIKNTPVAIITSIGDINGDGFNDITMGGVNFSRWLGQDILVCVQEEDHDAKFAIDSISSYFLQNNRQYSIWDKNSLYKISLYNLNGQKADSYSQFLNAGKHIIPLEIKGLSFGTYILRLSSGKESVECTIFITN